MAEPENIPPPEASPPAPTADPAVLNLLSQFSLAFLSAGAVLLFEGKYILGPLAILIAILSYIIGYKWPAFKRRFSHSLVSVIDRLANISTDIIVFLAFGVLTYIVISLHELRSDLNEYVLPRTVTATQSADLLEYLSHHEPHSVTVKVYVSPYIPSNLSPSPSDQEATIYAGQLFTALKNTDWRVTIDYSNKEPLPRNPGLCIQTGGSSAPVDAKHDPVALLQAAFAAAHIAVNCSGGNGGGDLFVLVGHRQLVLGDQEPLLLKIGRWMESVSR
jgi:hypothetical protein